MAFQFLNQLKLSEQFDLFAVCSVWPVHRRELRLLRAWYSMRAVT